MSSSFKPRPLFLCGETYQFYTSNISGEKSLLLAKMPNRLQTLLHYRGSFAPNISYEDSKHIDDWPTRCPCHPTRHGPRPPQARSSFPAPFNRHQRGSGRVHPTKPSPSLPPRFISVIYQRETSGRLPKALITAPRKSVITGINYSMLRYVKRRLNVSLPTKPALTENGCTAFLPGDTTPLQKKAIIQVPEVFLLAHLHQSLPTAGVRFIPFWLKTAGHTWSLPHRARQVCGWANGAVCWKARLKTE